MLKITLTLTLTLILILTLTLTYTRPPMFDRLQSRNNSHSVCKNMETLLAKTYDVLALGPTGIKEPAKQ